MTIFVVYDYDQFYGAYSSEELAEEAYRRLDRKPLFISRQLDVDKLPHDSLADSVVGMNI